jgi:hypothetical protein
MARKPAPPPFPAELQPPQIHQPVSAAAQRGWLRFLYRPRFWVFLILGYLIYCSVVVGVHAWGLSKFDLHGVPAFSYPPGTPLKERRRMFEAKEQLREWPPEKWVVNNIPFGITVFAGVAGLVIGGYASFRILKDSTKAPVGLFAAKFIVPFASAGLMLAGIILGMAPAIFADFGGGDGLLSWFPFGK